MSNFFDQFDELESAPARNAESQSTNTGNFFDQFDEPELAGDRSFWDATKDTAQDLAVSLAKAPITAVEGVAGLVDIPTGGRFSKALENEDGLIGFRPRQAKEMLDQLHTDSFRQKQQEFQNADGVLDKTMVALQNPSLVTNTVAESSASMLMGGAGGRLLKTAFPKVSGATAGAVGEGSMMAGAQAAEIRNETEDGLLTSGQSAAAAGTGVLGGLFGYFGGQLANKLGIGDVDTLLAQGLRASDLAEDIAQTSAKSVPRRVIEGAITEGFLEELPQSVSETIIKNLALDKQWSEGLDDAIVMGTLAGMAVGGPVGAVRQTGAAQTEVSNDVPIDDSSPPRRNVSPDEEIATMEREVEEGDSDYDAEISDLLGDSEKLETQGEHLDDAESVSALMADLKQAGTMASEISPMVPPGVNPFDQFDQERPPEGLFDGIRQAQADRQRAALEAQRLQDEQATAILQYEDDQRGFMGQVARLQEQARFEPLAIDGPTLADLTDHYSPDPSVNFRPSPAEPRLNVPAEDSRLTRPEYRSQLNQMAAELVKGGGVSYVRDSNDRIIKRTPSLNPGWFKTLNENSETSMSVEDTQAAIARALAGEKLGVRQLRVVGAALDTIGEERGSYARELRAMRENAKQDRRQAYEQWLEATNVPANAEFESMAWPETPGEQFKEMDYLADQSMEDRATSELVSAADSLGADWAAIDTALSAGDINAQTQALTQLIWDSRNEHRQPTKPADQPAASPASAPGRPATSQRADRALEKEPANAAQTTAEIVDATAAAEAATAPENNLPEPTAAQKEAGNYKKAHVKIQGLDVSIENARGSTRSGTDNDGNAWSVTMHNHYGYLKRTEGADGENIDVFIGPNPDSSKVFIVDQVNQDGTFDEHKLLLGFDSKLKARSGYKSNYSNGWKVGPITSMTMEELKGWLKNGDTTKPLNADHFPDAGKMISDEPRPSAGVSVSETDKNSGGRINLTDTAFSLRNPTSLDSEVKVREVTGRTPVSEMEAHNVVVRILDGIRSGSGIEGLQGLKGIYPVASFSEFPAAVQNYAKQQGHDGKGVEGVIHNDSIYVNRDALGTSEDVERVVFHELYGHYGLRKLFDTSTRQAMSGLYVAIGGSKGLNQLASKHGIDLRHYARGYAVEVEAGRMDLETKQSILTEELLAHLAQDNKPSIKRFARELIGALRTWLRSKGFLRLSKVSDTELFHLLKQARVVVNTGKVKGNPYMLFALKGGDPSSPPAVSPSSNISAPARRIIGDDPVLAGWTLLAQNDDVFQLPTSKKKMLTAIFKELEGDAGIRVERADELAMQNDYGAKMSWRVTTREGEKAAIYQKGKSVWIDVSDLKQGENGKRIYNAVANYAYTTDRVFIGDPAGLSDTALTRRLENMISSALKFGTTKHLWPHERQIEGNEGMGIPGIRWKDGDDAHNLRQMIDASYQATVKQFPKIRDLRYNPEADRFEDLSDDNREFKRSDFQKLAETARGVPNSGRARLAPTAGRTSIERAVFTGTLSRGTRQEVSDILAKLVGLSGERPQRLSGPDNAILYSLSSRTTSEEPRPSAGVFVSGEKKAKPDVTTEGKPDNFQAPGTGATPFEKRIDSALRKMVDKMKPLLNTQKEIEKFTGDKIDENLDAYLAEEAFHGKTENDLRKLQENYVEPLAEYMAKHNISREELDLFLWAAHASERNKQIAKINPKMPDGGSGMTTAKSLEVLKKAQAEGKLETLKGAAKFVYGALKHRRDLMKGVLLEDGMVDTWDESYKYYVPLKGQAQNEGGGKTPKIGRGFDIRGKENFRALGRSTMPESPVLHAIKDTTETIIRYRKNEVGNVLLDLIQAHPNDDYWQVFDASHPEFERRLLKAEGKDQVGTAKVIDKSRYFITKKNGKEYYIKLQDEQLLMAMKNMGAEGLSGPLQAMAKVTRYLSSINTSLNPEFVISNFVRDIQSAIYNAMAEQDLHDGKIKGEQIVGKMVKDVPIAIRAIKASLSGTPLEGTAGEWQTVFDQFRDNGAKTGWYDMKDIDGQAKDLERLITLSQTGVRSNVYKAGRATMTLIDNINTAIENGVRLAVYKNAVDAGVSQKQAASLAKNLTVNFNRKGEWGAVMNALWMFTNAAIQGNKVFYRAMATRKLNPDGTKSLNKAQKAAIVMTGLAIGLATLNRSMAGDDDDGESLYDKVPGHVKEKNIVIMKSIFGGEPGEYWSLPLPYGYNIFHVTGTEIEAAFNNPKNAGKSAVNVVKAMIGSFVPMSLAETADGPPSIIRTFAPSAVKPFADLDANANFFGGNIYLRNLFGVPRPESELARRSTPEVWKWTASFLNEATGGSAYRSGKVDLNPDKLDYIFKYYTGGVGAFTSRLTDAVAKKSQGIELEDREIPFVRRLSGKVNHYPDQNHFYDRRDEIGQLEKEWKSLKGRDRMDFYREYGERIRLKAFAKTTESHLKRLRARRDAVDEDKALTAKEKDVKLKEIERQTKLHIDRFNKRWPKE